jgi:hypothetical protein
MTVGRELRGELQESGKAGKVISGRRNRERISF